MVLTFHLPSNLFAARGEGGPQTNWKASGRFPRPHWRGGIERSSSAPSLPSPPNPTHPFPPYLPLIQPVQRTLRPLPISPPNPPRPPSRPSPSTTQSTQPPPCPSGSYPHSPPSSPSPTNDHQAPLCLVPQTHSIHRVPLPPSPLRPLTSHPDTSQLLPTQTTQSIYTHCPNPLTDPLPLILLNRNPLRETEVSLAVAPLDILTYLPLTLPTRLCNRKNDISPSL